ncbi:MAG: hypothetical protein WCE75_09045 [Terracidiphilus sp.]
MEILAAQKEIRKVYLGGFAGQLVSGSIWLLSAAAATWYSQTSAILVLVVGGAFIFPLTQLVLRLMGGPASLPKGHPLNALATQIAFTLPMTFPLIYAATAHHLYWFYPAFMIAVGAHYLPFTFLYGMRQFAVLSVLLVAGGVAIGVYLPAFFSLGGWVTACVLLVFAFLGRRVALAAER